MSLLKSASNNESIHRVHKDRFKQISSLLDVYFHEYVNKKKLVILFSYWLLSIRVISEIYGEKAIKDYCSNKVKSPLRFSYLYEFNVNADIKLDKGYISLKVLLLYFIDNIFLPGSNLSSKKDKLLMKITNIFITNEPFNTSFSKQKKLIEIICIYFKEDKLDPKSTYFISCIPEVFFSEQFKTLRKKELIVKGSAHAFMDFIGYEKLLLINRKIIIKGKQHGGGYDTFEGDFYSDYEIDLCDEFLGWGLSENNEQQFKFSKNNFKKDLYDLKRIIWVERGLYPLFLKPMNIGQFLQFTNKNTIKYINSELKSSSIDYYSLPHPTHRQSSDYEGFRGKIFKNTPFKGEDIINNEDIIIFDNCTSTLMHYCIENNIVFILVVPRESNNYLKKLPSEWFSLLRENNLAFFEDENQNLSRQLNLILSKPYATPFLINEFHQKYFSI